MARCWTCGQPVSGYQYTCPSCESLLPELKSLQKKFDSHGKGISERLDYMAQVQREGFSTLKDTLSEKLSEVVSAIEWGFEELSWQLEQQTTILQSIDHTLKTPSETQANELRKMAEELRHRGVLDKSEEFFLKSLQLNPLDYRIYVGLAETYLQSNKFDKAKTLLESSLPHAPKEEKQLAAWCADCQTFVWVQSNACAQCHRSRLSGHYYPRTFDWKSYSYRLIGRIYACGEDYSQAIKVLSLAIELSSEYEEGNYDYAQYCARTKDVVRSVPSLKKAILAKPLYFYLAQAERNFKPIRTETTKLLSRMSAEARREADSAVAKADSALERATKSVSKAREALRISGKSDVLKSSSLCESAEAKLKLAKDKVASGDYIAFLEAKPAAEESYAIANNAIGASEEEQRNYQRLLAGDIEKAEKEVRGAHKRLIVYPLVMGVLLGMLGAGPVGGTIGCFKYFSFSTTDQFEAERLALIIKCGLGGFLIGFVCTFIYCWLDYYRAKERLQELERRK